MNAQPFLSVVIPAYNEERRLPATLNSVLAYLKHCDYSWEVIVANDGSQDHTADLVQEFQKAIPNLILLDNAANRGKGFVVRQGVLRAQGEIILSMDADNSTKIEEVAKALSEFERGADLVIGSRRLPGSKIIKLQPFYRRLFGEVFRLYVKILFGFPYDDTQAGFKAIQQGAKEIFQRQTLWGWGFDVELLWLAKLLRLKVKEIPINWENSESSRVTFWRAARWPLDLLRVRLKRYKLDY